MNAEQKRKEILEKITAAIGRVERGRDEISISLNKTSGNYPTDEYWAKEVSFKAVEISSIAQKIILAVEDMDQAANELRDRFFAEERKKK